MKLSQQPERQHIKTNRKYFEISLYVRYFQQMHY